MQVAIAIASSLAAANDLPAGYTQQSFATGLYELLMTPPRGK